MAIDPEGIVDTLRELARLDPVELGLQAVLDQIVQAATTCCGVTGGVGLLLLGPDDQLHYVAGVQRRSWRRGTLAGVPSAGDRGWDQGVAECAGAPAPRPHRRTRLRPHRPPAVAAPGPGHQQRLRPPDHGHPGTGRGPPARGAHPELQFAVQHDARVEQARGVLMERERVDEDAASTLLHQQAQIEDRPIRAIAERILARVRR
jgi:hypothetical protein